MTSLAALSAYTTAARTGARLAGAAGLAGIAAVAVAVAVAVRSGDAAAAMAASLAASLGIVAAGVGSAAVMAGGRAAALAGEARAGGAAASADAAAVLARRARARVGWQQATVGGVLAAAAFAAAVLALRDGLGWPHPPAVTGAAAGSLLITAFAILVCERHLASLDPADLPEARGLASLLRVPIAVALICGVGCLLLYAGVTAGGARIGAYAGRLCAVLCLLVAGELVVRALATLFVPFPGVPDARVTAASTIARAIVLQRPPPVTAAVRDMFGIDLSRSWALAFMRAALLPVVAVLALFAWALSGVESLHVDQRAVYERFGAPVAVFGPGLHLRLPWPVGRLRPIELGVMHDVPIVFAAPGKAAPALPAAPLADAEADPGPAADRLWDETHPSEGAYIVASLSRGQQSFESVDIDLRVVYRIGLADASALAAAFAVNDPQRLVQAHTSRLLAHYFAHHTLPDILGQDRASFSRDIQTGLQAELDAAQSGLEVMAIVVEAIHPPPGASFAYHAVQAAQVRAHTQIAEQAGIAAKIGIDAKREATRMRDDAAATAHETVVDAQVRAIAFGADRTADAQNHDAFVLERRFDKLAAGLAHRQVLIVDHRLVGAASPTLDMRPPGSGSIAVPPPSEEQ